MAGQTPPATGATVTPEHCQPHNMCGWSRCVQIRLLDSSRTSALGRQKAASRRRAMTVAADAQLHHGAQVAEAYRCEFIFGFGSLISNPGFEHSEKVEPCYIKGWR
jgi:hypothetical protein